MCDKGPFLLVGLGNPGERYQGTRHNIGFMVADQLVVATHRTDFRRQDEAAVARIEADGIKVFVAKPLTFMNRSGQAVANLLFAHQVPLSKLLVIVDDFNLPIGKIRFRARGSDGGHNGLASLISCLGSDEFARLRIGIGDDFEDDPIGFVLGEFSTAELNELAEPLVAAAQGCLYFVNHGITKTMNKFN